MTFDWRAVLEKNAGRPFIPVEPKVFAFDRRKSLRSLKKRLAKTKLVPSFGPNRAERRSRVKVRLKASKWAAYDHTQSPNPIGPVFKAKKAKRKNLIQQFPKEWQALRLKVFERDGRACKLCNSTTQPHVDHVLSKVAYPFLAFDINNLRVLCRKCNFRKGRKQDWALIRKVCGTRS